MIYLMNKPKASMINLIAYFFKHVREFEVLQILNTRIILS